MIKHTIIVRYNKIVPNYIPQDIILGEKERNELFCKMLSEAIEQTKEMNPKDCIRDRVMGSYIIFIEQDDEKKITYILRGANLEVNVYDLDHSKNDSITQRTRYKVAEIYYDKWVEYCMNHY